MDQPKYFLILEKDWSITDFLTDNTCRLKPKYDKWLFWKEREENSKKKKTYRSYRRKGWRYKTKTIKVIHSNNIEIIILKIYVKLSHIIKEHWIFIKHNVINKRKLLLWILLTNSYDTFTLYKKVSLKERE